MRENRLFEFICYTILKNCIVLYNSFIFAAKLKTLAQNKKSILLKNNKIQDINFLKKINTSYIIKVFNR